MIASVLINGLWQGAPIVGTAYLLAAAIPKTNAATRYALWFVTLLALALVPVLATFDVGSLLTKFLHSHAPAPAYKVSLIPSGAFEQDAGAWVGSAIPWVLGIWLAGTALGFARLATSFIRIERIRRSARPLAGADHDVFVSDAVAVPIVAGIVSPAIVIPTALAAALAPADLQRIVQHERAHIRRNDPLLNLIARLIEAALFFNPWVRLAQRYLCAEREAACDDWVVEEIGSPDAYAACLAELAQTARPRSAPLLTPSVFGSRHSLVSRIERLSSLGPRRLTINTYALGGSVMLFIITALALGTFTPALALAPSPGSAGVPAPSTFVAAACADPNVDASVTDPAMPKIPHGLKAHGTTDVAVTIGPNGHVLRTSVLHSSGNATIDNAVVEAAAKSTYTPKVVNCAPVQGSYIFQAKIAPGP